MDSIMNYKYPILISVLVIVVIVFVYLRSRERMTDLQYSEYNVNGESDDILQQNVASATLPSEMESMPMSGQDTYPDNADFMGTTINFETNSGDLLPTDLLPKSQVTSEFDVSAPNTTDLSARNFLVAGSAFGIDTKGSTLKNPSYDIRGDIPIPVNMNVSPWNVSSYGPDPYARQMTIA